MRNLLEFELLVTLFGPLLGKETRVKCKGRMEMFGEVSRVVASWVDVKFMRDLARRQNFIERNRSGFKAEIILVSTIKINIQAH